MGFWTRALCITSLGYRVSSDVRDNHRVRLKIWDERNKPLHLHSKQGVTTECVEAVGEDFGPKIMEVKCNRVMGFRCLATVSGDDLTGTVSICQM